MSVKELSAVFQGKLECLWQGGRRKRLTEWKEVCDLAVQKAFCVVITGVHKRFPPGEVVTLLYHVSCRLFRNIICFSPGL